MNKRWKRPLGKVVAMLLALTMVLSPLTDVGVLNAQAADISIVDSQGYEEGAYAKWAAVSEADSYKAYVSSDGSNYTEINAAMIRKSGDYYRVDEVGLAKGSYTIKIEALKEGSVIATETTGSLTVTNYDRSGYAHFNYTEGVGAYKDDGTLKDNAVVLYVTEETKNTVSVTAGGTTVTGIGHILNSAGKDAGSGTNSKGGKANNNSDIIRKLAEDNTPLVVRIIGRVTAPEGLTTFNSIDYGGSVGDNGSMARMQSGKNITIEGIGSDAVIDGWGIHFICNSSLPELGKSFEVRNIAFRNVPEDCIGMEGEQEGTTITAPVERCWIHDCAFYGPTIANPAESDKDGGDGACDFKRGQYFTNSYCYYEGYHKTNLVGSSDTSLQYHLTYHHNYWKDCDSRVPLARQADIHMYNNIIEGQTSKTMDSRANSYIFSEYNNFINCKNPALVQSGGVIKSYKDSFTCCIEENSATTVTDKSEQVSSSCKYANFDTDESVSYVASGDYWLQEDLVEVKKTITAYAGPLLEKPVSPEEVSTSVILSDRMPGEAVSLPYSQALNSTYLTAKSATVDNIVFNVAKLASDCLSVGSNTTGQDIVFRVNTAVNITMEEVSATYSPVLCNESGISVLTGGGTVNNLPAGVYFIQSAGYDVGSGKFKEAKVASLSIEAYDPNAPVATEYAITVQNDGNGTAKANVAKATKGATVTLTATPNSGYEFDTWQVVSGSVTISSNKFVMPESDVIVKALFKESTGSGEESGGESGGGESGEGGSGGGAIGTGYVHNFTESGLNSGFYTFTACSTSTNKGSTTYNGLSLTTCLKMETDTNVAFTSTTAGTLVLVLDTGSAKRIYVDETKYAAADGIVTAALKAGAHNITKYDSLNVFYMEFIPENSDGGDNGGGSETPGTNDGGDNGNETPGTNDGGDSGNETPGTNDGGDNGGGSETPGTNDGGDKGTSDGGDNTPVNDEGLKVRLVNPDETYTYTGSAIKPAIIVTNNGEELIEGVDYTIKYTNNVNASTDKKKATITVKGKGNLTGSNSTTFVIEPKNIGSYDIIEGTVIVVKGSKATPILTYNNKKLTTKDFTNLNAKYKYTEDDVMTIIGKGNFKGSRHIAVNVVEKQDLKKFTVSVGKEDLFYNGTEQKPTITVTDKETGTKLQEYVDYTIAYGNSTVNAGTVKFTVIGKGLYSGTVAKSYKIKPLAVKDGSIKVTGVNAEGYEFAAKGVTIGDDLTVTYKDEVLTEGKDYKITYAGNKKVGTAKYTVKFQGNYKGSTAVTGTFEIKPMPLINDVDGLKIVVGDKAYTGKPGIYKSAPIVSVDGVTLKASNYTVTYYKDAELKDQIGNKNKVELAENQDSVTVYVKLVGKGNYAAADGEYATATYEVCKKPAYDLAKARVTFWDGDKKITKVEYTGLEIEPTVKVEVKVGKTWTEVPADKYEVSYSNNVDKGTASVVVTATGEEYAGSKTAKFKIVARNLKSLTDLLKNLFGIS